MHTRKHHPLLRFLKLIHLILFLKRQTPTKPKLQTPMKPKLQTQVKLKQQTQMNAKQLELMWPPIHKPKPQRMYLIQKQ